MSGRSVGRRAGMWVGVVGAACGLQMMEERMMSGFAAEGTGGTGVLKVSSTALAQGQPIPQEFTCQGKNISPALQWTNAPVGTKSFALIMDDPDAPAGTWVHWVIYDLPGTAAGIAGNIAAVEEPTSGGRQGVNSFHRVGYGGPCPPAGSAHRYFFRVYALDGMLKLNAKATRAAVDQAMKGHILAEGELMGTYRRQ
jgi:Raf kinase inhibitor-like YbhB/YbcL family protein